MRLGRSPTIVARHNTFGPGGCSDGVQIGASGITIGPGNYFHDKLQGACAPHVDAIQVVGGNDLIITGNYLVNNTVHLGIYDGAGNVKVSHNTFDANPGGQALQIGGVQGMHMHHNTFCDVTLGIGTKFANEVHSGWIVENNLFDAAEFAASGDQPGCGSDCILRYNLKTNGGTTTPTGTNTVTGTVSYTGSPVPLPRGVTGAWPRDRPGRMPAMMGRTWARSMWARRWWPPPHRAATRRRRSYGARGCDEAREGVCCSSTKNNMKYYQSITYLIEMVKD